MGTLESSMSLMACANVTMANMIKAGETATANCLVRMGRSFKRDNLKKASL